MTEPRRVYLDNAATSWPKPESVYRAMERFLRDNGAPAGRGTYGEAVQVDRAIQQTRRSIAELFHIADSRRVIFTAGGTDSLNMALHGLAAEGTHIVTSVAEHNSILRPLRFLTEQRGMSRTVVACNAGGIVDPDDIRRAMTPKTSLVAVTHASNVSGAIQPLEEIGQIARQHGALFLVDAAQSAGHVPIDVERMSIDLLATSGHKGLLGPLGIGVLYVGPGAEIRLLPYRQGGTGTQSESEASPNALPQRYEAGNLNVPGIVGLGAGVSEILTRGLPAIRRHETSLLERLLQGLENLPGVRLHGPRELERRLGVVSLSATGYDVQELAMALDAGFRIQVRAGLHCAPLMHQALGTLAGGGTLRISLGFHNTETDVDECLAALAALLSPVGNEPPHSPAQAHEP